MEAKVQALAQSKLSNVPPQYIQPPELRPNPASFTNHAVPLIDFSTAGDVRAEIGQACREWGAFQVINHGVPIRLLGEMRGAGLAFFEGYDVADKLKYSCDPSAAATEGYGTRMLSLHALKKLLGSSTRTSLLDYPPCPQPELTHGLQSHSDGAITLLIQDDVGGLEVLKDGEWVTVKPLSDAIVVLLSDQNEVITNGEYKSAVHRAVTNANRARLLVATFHDPSKARKIAPASKLVTKFVSPRYLEVVYGDYVASWYTKGPEGNRNIDALLLWTSLCNRHLLLAYLPFNFACKHISN